MGPKTAIAGRLQPGLGAMQIMGLRSFMQAGVKSVHARGRVVVRARPWLGLVLALCGLLSSAGASADEVRVLLEGANTEKLPFLKTYVTLVDSDGKPIRSKSGYKLFQDTVEQKELQITYTPVSEAKEPIDLVAVVQLSSAMEPAIKSVRSGLEKLAKALLKHHAESRVALIGFATEVKRLEDFGHPNAIARELEKLAVDADATESRLIDALRVGIDLAREKPERRRRIVLFSDGIDTSAGKEAFTEVARRAREAGAVIDSIGFTQFEAGRLRTLIDLSKTTAGTARRCKTAEDIPARFAEVADGLFSTGIISFGLTQSGDNASHAIQVAFRKGNEDTLSEPLQVQLPQFEPAETAGRGWMFWVLVVAGGLFGLLILLYIVGRILEK